MLPPQRRKDWLEVGISRGLTEPWPPIPHQRKPRGNPVRRIRDGPERGGNLGRNEESPCLKITLHGLGTGRDPAARDFLPRGNRVIQPSLGPRHLGTGGWANCRQFRKPERWDSTHLAGPHRGGRSRNQRLRLQEAEGGKPTGWFSAP